MTQSELETWCREQLSLHAQESGRLVAVSGDASFRRYYRFLAPGRSGQQRSWVAVHAPPAHENNEAFVAVQQLLSGQGVRVPELLAWDRERGFLLLGDFGDQLLLPLLDADSVDGHYRRAMDSLLQLQAIAVPAHTLPSYDEARLRAEMALFPQWFVGGLLEYPLNVEEERRIERVFARLVENALAQPQVLVHRDFHSRNIMVLEGGEFGLIDFQDAVTGPVTYDLVSLLRDCYVHWPQPGVATWALEYRDRAVEAGILAPVADAPFLTWFDLMGLQRHIKVLGIFARLYLRDGKAQYLDDLPLVIQYTLSVARCYPELGDFVGWFEAELRPRIAQQSWAREVVL